MPRLIELQNLRGTFHNHTTESDGHNTLQEMAEAAHELGLEYLGIADHSKSSFQAHGLDENQLLKQVEQIRQLNKAFDDDFQVFCGVECDILKDGQLGFPGRSSCPARLCRRQCACFVHITGERDDKAHHSCDRKPIRNDPRATRADAFCCRANRTRSIWGKSSKRPPKPGPSLN